MGLVLSGGNGSSETVYDEGDGNLAVLIRMNRSRCRLGCKLVDDHKDKSLTGTATLEGHTWDICQNSLAVGILILIRKGAAAMAGRLL